MAQEDLNRLTIDKERYSPASRAGKRKRFWVIICLVTVLAAGGVWSLIAKRSVEVEVATVSLVYPSQTFSLLNASGYVVAQRKSAVSSKATGRLEWLGVEEGSVVRRGDLLARLENRDSAAAKEQAAANLAVARDQLEQAQVEQKDASRALSRSRQLVSEGIIAQADYDTAEARYRRAAAAGSAAQSAIRGAQAALAGAEASLDYTLIRAPFDGVVLTKNADVGDIVTPLAAAANAKAAVVTLADMGSLQVEADVSEANLGKVRVGQPCEILLDALPEARFRGVLHTIVPTADRSKGSVLVKVRFLDKDKRLLPEMSAKVAFLEREVQPGEGRPRVALPPASVAKRDGRDVVFVVTGDKAVQTPVTLGAKLGDMVEVLSGVKAGERIAVKPLDKLRDQGRVKTAEK
ncbi:MAG: efflux transporter periplasmic adaptor subunit [Geobacteraceae bacterium GWC2_58_44]|nr:MAG: efflux transporter periplasmic adaptor subunit [Geobacteraceae bacterium GWC2_58_44]HBG07832.1 efflux RND transporter periplasmic adaptor subunit [Geobacter sp.]